MVNVTGAGRRAIASGGHERRCLLRRPLELHDSSHELRHELPVVAEVVRPHYGAAPQD